MLEREEPKKQKEAEGNRKTCQQTTAACSFKVEDPNGTQKSLRFQFFFLMSEMLAQS